MLLLFVYTVLAIAASYIYSIYNTASMLQTIEPGIEMSRFNTFVYTTGKKLTSGRR